MERHRTAGKLATTPSLDVLNPSGGVRPGPAGSTSPHPGGGAGHARGSCCTIQSESPGCPGRRRGWRSLAGGPVGQRGGSGHGLQPPQRAPRRACRVLTAPLHLPARTLGPWLSPHPDPPHSPRTGPSPTHNAALQLPALPKPMSSLQATDPCWWPWSPP